MRDAELRAILEKLRSQGRDDSRYEAKACASGLSKDVWESVSAFANTGGGVLLLGVSEAEGFAPVCDFQADKVCDQFVSGMGDGGTSGRLTNPPEYRVERDAYEGATILVICIEELPATQKPCYITARGILAGSYKRIDDKDVKLSSSEVYEIQSATVIDHSDRAIVDEATTSDLDPAVCEAIFSRALVLTPRSMRGADATEERMKRLGLTDSRGRVVRAGLLVAGSYPQQFFPKLCVDVAVHPGTVKGSAGVLRFRDRTICEGTLGEMIGDAVAAVSKNLRRRSVVSGLGRLDELEVPEVVLREAVTNALIHRSYNERFDGESVAVDIFDDRIEVTNPGGLWGKSREDLADGRSCCRNATIMRLMTLAPLPEGPGSPAEGNGSGILLMMNEMASKGLEPPEFYPAIDHFKVILRRPQEEGDRASAVSRGRAFVERFLREHGEATVHEIAEGCDLSLSQARRRVGELVASGAVEATAPATSKNRRYRSRR